MKVIAANAEQLIANVEVAFKDTPFKIEQPYFFTTYDEDAKCLAFVAPDRLFQTTSDGTRTLHVNILYSPVQQPL